MASKEPALKSPVKAAAKPKPVFKQPAESAHEAAPAPPTPFEADASPAQVATPAQAPAEATADLPAPAPVAPAAPESLPVAAPAPVADLPITEPSTPPAVDLAVATIAKEIPVMEATINNTADTAQTYVADAGTRARTAMEKGARMFEDMNEFGKGNVEALVESGKIAARGIESLGQEAAEYSRKSFESATAALKNLSSVKSPTDFFRLHTDYVRASFDSMVAETSKSTEAMLKLAGEVAQPISNRVAVAVEKAKVAA